MGSSGLATAIREIETRIATTNVKRAIGMQTERHRVIGLDVEEGQGLAFSYYFKRNSILH